MVFDGTDCTVSGIIHGDEGEAETNCRIFGTRAGDRSPANQRIDRSARYGDSSARHQGISAR